jgi:hypothetical protein
MLPGYWRRLPLSAMDTRASFPFRTLMKRRGAVRIIEDFPLDIFTVMRGESYGDLADYRRQTTINGAKIDFLNAEGLIRLKANSTREKDQIDIAALRKRTVGNS